jgi:hypothetical protein
VRAAAVLIGRVWKRMKKDQRKLVLHLDTLVLLLLLIVVRTRYEPETFRNYVQRGNK